MLLHLSLASKHFLATGLIAALVAMGGCSKSDLDVATASHHQAAAEKEVAALGEAPVLQGQLNTSAPLSTEALSYQTDILRVVNLVQSGASQEAVVAAVRQVDASAPKLARATPRDQRAVLFDRLMRETLTTRDVGRAYFMGVSMVHKASVPAPSPSSAVR